MIRTSKDLCPRLPHASGKARHSRSTFILNLIFSPSPHFHPRTRHNTPTLLYREITHPRHPHYQPHCLLHTLISPSHAFSAYAHFTHPSISHPYCVSCLSPPPCGSIDLPTHPPSRPNPLNSPGAFRGPGGVGVGGQPLDIGISNAVISLRKRVPRSKSTFFFHSDPD